MRLNKCIISCTLFLGYFSSWVVAQKAVACYIAAWSVSRTAEGKFSVLNADTEHCTHIIYAFMGVDPYTSEIKSLDPYVDLVQNGRGHNQLVKLKKLKEANPKVKILVSIGGNSEKGKKFSNLARDQDLRQAFIKSAIALIKKYDLDGIDICWQFPGQRGGRNEDKQNSVILLQEMKDAFHPHGYQVTVHILGKRYIIDEFDIRSVSEIVDYINLMAFEYSGPWHKTTGIMAPLRSKDQNNVQFSVDYMIKKGAQPSKLLLGMVLHGHAYILEETPTEDHLLGLYSVETFREPWTNDRGIIGYHEICHNYKDTSGFNTAGWKRVWDEESQTPMAFKDKNFISYDDEESLLLKAELVESRSLGGVAFWSLDTDDFRGLCNGNKYPMVSAVSDFINKKKVSRPPASHGPGTTSVQNPGSGVQSKPPPPSGFNAFSEPTSKPAGAQSSNPNGFQHTTSRKPQHATTAGHTNNEDTDDLGPPDA